MMIQKKIPIHAFLLTLILLCSLLFVFEQRVNAAANAQTPSANDTTDRDDSFSISVNNDEGGLSGNLRILITLTLLSLAPSILIMLTSYTRIIVVLSFTRTALGTQSAPSNQVLAGLALFLTWFIMNPFFTQINDNAIKPFDAGAIGQEEALERAIEPLRSFMYAQVEDGDVRLFLDIAEMDPALVENIDEIPNNVLIPSFIIGELRSAFIMGFLIYVPFIVIDMVVASVLMSMGMMMLPPTTISLPFKILLFILADGWNLIIMNLVRTFN